MYLVGSNPILQQLKFEMSPPLTDLIRAFFLLFRPHVMIGLCSNICRQPLLSDLAIVEQLGDCKVVIQMISDAMERTDWPDECDKVESGNYPRGE